MDWASNPLQGSYIYGYHIFFSHSEVTMLKVIKINMIFLFHKQGILYIFLELFCFQIVHMDTIWYWSLYCDGRYCESVAWWVWAVYCDECMVFNWLGSGCIIQVWVNTILAYYEVSHKHLLVAVIVLTCSSTQNVCSENIEIGKN